MLSVGDADMNTRPKRESKTDRQRQDAGADNFKAGGSNKAKNSNDKNQGAAKSKLTQSNSQPVQTGTRPKSGTTTRSPRWWQGLRIKATLSAIAVSTIPILVLGGTAYYLTNKNITQNITGQQQARVISLTNSLDRFMLGRYQDIQTLAGMSIFSTSQVRRLTSNTSKQAVLDRYVKNGQGYDSLVFINLNGDVIVQSSGQVITNYSKIDYFQAALKSNRPVITSPRKSLATGDFSIFAAAPVKDPDTGETIGVVRSRTPVKYLSQILQNQAEELSQSINGFGREEYFAFNDRGKIFIAPASHTEYLGKDVKTIFPQAAARLQAAPSVGSVEDFDRVEREEYQISYAPLKKVGGVTQVNWGAIVAQPKDEVFAGLRATLLSVGALTGATVLIAGAITSILVNRSLRPIVNASKAVRKLGQGQLDTRIAVSGDDEVAALGANINLMAEKLQAQIEQQQDVAERANLFAVITLRIRLSLNFYDILNSAVN